ncbi:sterol desaturase family protein [Xanthobacter agilis]|jgi:beta-carotene 3-hydroxylase|uniref:Beta-carotene 3-hydroxylase n=1 Tax=Xanthobacter agilis TaxID=47492 RepID=A0ABU0LHF9_XANAG|nr:sterol desaturase family protein [Xanthobacter agilis]MDQ0506586.1 beta-carotene 3-hydroxylase [Xanthobacter agilis]
MGFAINLLIVLLTVAAMEGVAWWAHKYVMHGFGWGWHKSHHEPRTGLFERNDLYALFFAAIAIALIFIGRHGAPVLWVGVGMTAYGALYFVAHDGIAHQRWPFQFVPRRGYLKRLVQAHRLHHAVDGKDGCVSFGFLYAPPVPALKARLKALHGPALKSTPPAE